MRLTLATTSSEVKGEPSLKRTFGRNANSHVNGSTCRQEMANVGVQRASASLPTKLS
jgi:hypothetical protein